MSIEKIKSVSDQISNRVGAVKGKGEEATKQSLILPMLDALGYDIWNPNEVCPEYEADFAIKKAGQKEKVDLAILIGSIPRIYFEVKSIDSTLDGHHGQLARYFNSTQSVTLGILTNGIEWRFFTDTGNPNVMDSHPFHVSRLDTIDQGLDIIYRFNKSVFSPEAIRDYATELLYTAKIADFLKLELDLRERDPSEYLIRWILKSDGMYDGVVNSNVVDRFKGIAKNSLTRVIRDIVRRSVSALDEQVSSVAVVAPNTTNDQVDIIDSKKADGIQEGAIIDPVQKSQIITTESELNLFAIIKEQFDRSILANELIFDASLKKRVAIDLAYKDTTGYFGIYFNKPGWWLFRAVLDSKKPWIGFNLDKEIAKSLVPQGIIIMDPSPWSEFRVEIKSIIEIQLLSRLIFATFQSNIKDKERAQNAVQQGDAPESGTISVVNQYNHLAGPR